MPSLTIVSGYWKITNKHGSKYDAWFANSLKINCPYVFFGTKETIEMARQFRGSLPTTYIELEIKDFHTSKYAKDIIVHPAHCPSTELNLIWHEKIFLMKKVVQLNPYCSDYFAWVDAGICTYRTTAPPSVPFPSVEKLQALPQNKFVFTSSDAPVFRKQMVGPTRYFHYIAGTSYLLHSSFVDNFAAIYDSYLASYLPQRGTIYTDQVLLTYIYKDHPELFHRLGHGYGEIVPLLY